MCALHSLHSRRAVSFNLQLVRGSVQTCHSTDSQAIGPPFGTLKIENVEDIKILYSGLVSLILITLSITELGKANISQITAHLYIAFKV